MLKALLLERLAPPNGKEVRIPQVWIVGARSIGYWSEQIIERVLSDASYMEQLKGALRDTVVGLLAAVLKA